jgi:hypothetical protein
VRLVRLSALAATIVVAAGCGGTNGPDPYPSFHVGDGQDAVMAQAEHAYGNVVSSSGDPGGIFCVSWADDHFTRLCFLDGVLYDKSRS